MLRFFRPRHSVLNTARLPIRYEVKHQAGQLGNVQRVRFEKRPFRWKSLVGAVIVTYVGISVYDRYVLDPLADTLDGLPDPQDGKGKGKRDVEEEDAPLFIPFPFTTRDVKPVPYRGTDPEWQEFIKLSKDKDKIQRVKAELANFVRLIISQHPMLVSHCGKEMKLQRFWLDVDFPTHPPPSFERTGLEITDDFVAISTIPVDANVVLKINKVLWPAPLAQSLWSFTTVLLKDDFSKFASLFGIQIGTPITTMDQVLAKHAELTRGLPTKKDPKEGPPALPPSIPGQTPSPSKEKIPILADEAAGNQKVGPISPPFISHFAKAFLAFKVKFAAVWKPTPQHPPRGCILVGGFVELDTPKAWLVLDVRAAWNPKTRQYDHPSMVIALRRMQMKKQSPVAVVGESRRA